MDYTYNKNTGEVRRVKENPLAVIGVWLGLVLVSYLAVLVAASYN